MVFSKLERSCRVSINDVAICKYELIKMLDYEKKIEEAFLNS